MCICPCQFVYIYLLEVGGRDPYTRDNVALVIIDTSYSFIHYCMKQYNLCNPFYDKAVS